MHIYGKDGDTFSFSREGDAPEGFVLMSEERPDNFHICSDNGDGTGDWAHSEPLKIALELAWSEM